MSIKPIDLHKLSGKHVILIPIRSFSDGKSRLSSKLNPRQRQNLMIQCADRVITATGTLPTIIVSSDPEVQSFAANRHASALDDPGGGLNQAIQSVFDRLRYHRIGHVTVAHGDLPLAQDLTQLAIAGKLTIVPDRRRDGTNVISMPGNLSFDFHYGPRSFKLHLKEAEKRGLEVVVNEDASLTLDIDTPDDLEEALAGNHFSFRDSDR